MVECKCWMHSYTYDKVRDTDIKAAEWKEDVVLKAGEPKKPAEKVLDPLKDLYHLCTRDSANGVTYSLCGEKYAKLGRDPYYINVVQLRVLNRQHGTKQCGVCVTALNTEYPGELVEKIW